MNEKRGLWQILRFGLIFLALILVFAVLFERYKEMVGWIYVLPISRAASFLLWIAGVEGPVDTSNLSEGFCELSLGSVDYLITQACTGLFTCSLFISASLAYPAGSRLKLIALLVGVPAFVSFGILRLVIMAAVALIAPSRIEIFHVYIMSIANLGFALFIWTYWIDVVSKAQGSDTLSG